MARKTEEYVIGILFPKKDRTEIKYVTSVGDHHTAYWEDGKKAEIFAKSTALDMCQGFAWNGIAAIPILKESYITFENPVESEEEV